MEHAIFSIYIYGFIICFICFQLTKQKHCEMDILGQFVMSLFWFIVLSLFVVWIVGVLERLEEKLDKENDKS